MKTCRNAFTLAEVLITLGIIGVVAAMTMPTLIASYQKRVIETQLKRAYAVQIAGYEKMLADAEAQSLGDTEVFQKISNSRCTISEGRIPSNCEAFIDELHKYFNFSLISASETSNLGFLMEPAYAVTASSSASTLPMETLTPSYIAFSDNTIIRYGMFLRTADTMDTETIKSLGGRLLALQAALILDVNGLKKPNIMGEDQFAFYLSSDGKLFPYGGRDASIFETGNPDMLYWRNMTSLCGEPDDKTISINSPMAGYGCAARVMENDWKIDYGVKVISAPEDDDPGLEIREELN